MASLNKVFLIGNLTQDPELRYTANGAAVSDLRLASSRQYTTKDGDRREETLFIDVTVWNRQAENCCQFLKKGRMVHVEGYLKTDSWDDKTTGEKRTKVKVEAERVQFLDRRDDAGGSGPADDDAPAREPRRASSEPRGSGSGGGSGSGNGSGPSRGFGGPPAPGPSPRRPSAPAEPEGDDDDIPF